MTPLEEPDRANDPAVAAVRAASNAALSYLTTVRRRSVAPDRRAVAGIEQLLGDLDDLPRDPVAVLEELHTYGSPATVATTGGRFFGLVVGGTLPAALGARVLASAWDQLVLNDETSPVGCALERCAGAWALDALGLPADAQVSFVTGATMANFSCLAAARHSLTTRLGYDLSRDGLRDAPRLRALVSEESHVTVLKALTLLGWGTAQIERVPTDAQGRVIPEQLPEIDPRTIVCLQAGNVNSGSFDPFTRVIQIARESGAWVHVDGAFGLWAAASPNRSRLTSGLAGADSWATDTHKWLNTPYDCGMAIVRDASGLHAAMATRAPYLGGDEPIAPKDLVPEFSRSARGVEVWAALRSLGRQGLAELVETSCRQAEALAEGLHDAGYEILNEVCLNQVVARVGSAEQHARIVALVRHTGECWFGPTLWQGRSALRFSIANWSTTHADIGQSISAIEAATARVLSEPTTDPRPAAR